MSHFKIIKQTGLWGLCLLLGSTLVFAECQVLDSELAEGQYRGGCKNGLAHGYGEVDGIASYRGDFREGKKHGKGIKVMSNGDRYAGEFADDYRHGKGTYIWGPKTQWAGDRYQGDFVRDLRHGYGVFTWDKGDRYEGLWEDNYRLGPTVMEQRRARANQTAQKILQPGVEVCREARLGIASQVPLKAKVLAFTEEKLRLELLSVAGNNKVAYAGHVLQSGSQFEDEALNWRVCAA